MKPKHERLGRTAAVKATMLQAHLAWAQKQIHDLDRLTRHLDAESAEFVTRRRLATDWVPFRCLIRVDIAIAGAVGGPAERVFRDLGKYSATINLQGVYKTFISSEPHRFFGQVSVLHGQFQNFGRSRYEKTGERAGRITFDNYKEYSPVYCASGQGYFEEALRMMHVPGVIAVDETSCQCAGDAECVYEIAW